MPLFSLLQPFGIDLFCFGRKFLVFNLVGRNLKVKYRRSFLGLFWTLLSPLAMTLIYYFVFKVILNIKVPHYLAFILSGVFPWAFFSQSVLEGMESIVGNWGLLSKVPIPLQIFPYVGTVTNLVTLCLALPVLLGMSIVSGVRLGASLILLVFYLTALFLMAYGFSLILAVGFVFFRDLRHFLGIVMQLWFYATPVLYNETMVPAKYRFALALNPLAPVFTGLQTILWKGLWPSASSLLGVLLWSIAVISLAAALQKFGSHELVENL